jgi:GNAT superfamily N-acetyltransferase
VAKSLPEGYPGISADDLRRWQAGWGRARSFAPATEDDGVLRVDIGLPGRFVEHVVLGADDHPRRLDRVAARVLGDRDPWLTVPTRDAARTADRLHEHGLRTPPLPEWMMWIALADQRRATLPQDYSWDLAAEPEGVVHLTVQGPDDEVAATGQQAVIADCAVPDKIETFAAHRRRGLGGAMMTILAEAAADLGATHGLLMASTQGRALYTTLGWTTLCPVVVGRLWE